MAARNSVEATLLTRFEDGITRGIEHTKNALDAGFATMRGGAESLASGFDAAFHGMASWVSGFAGTLHQKASESQSHFGKIGLGASALALLLVGAFMRMGKAVADFFLNVASESSELLELKLAFESLTATMGVSAGVMQGQLRNATEGLVSSSVLLRNANRVLSADIPITADQYVRLVGNVFKLSKAAGVDAPQALNTLTDALIRGNARGFQAIGIHINVKDAISQMAEAAGQSAATLGTGVKLQGFYNQLLEVTSAAVQRNAADYFSLADALTKVDLTWSGFKKSIGEAIGRSAVFEEILKRLSKALDTLALNGGTVDRLALAVNRFVLAAMRGIATVAEGIASLDFILAPVWAGIKAIFLALVEGVVWVGGMIVQVTGRIAEALSLIPGIVGQRAAALVPHLADLVKQLDGLMGRVQRGFNSSFDNMGVGSAKLRLWAEDLRGTAADLERFAGIVIHGSAGVRQHGAAAQAAAGEQKQLNEQVKAYNDLLKELGQKTYAPEIAAYARYGETLTRIEKLTGISGQKKNELRRMAYKIWLDEMLKLDREAQEKAAQQQREVEQLNAMASAAGAERVRQTQVAQLGPGQLSDDVSYRVAREAELARRKEWEAIQGAAHESRMRNTPDWIKPLMDVHAKLQQLNQIGMNPFRQTMNAMKESVLDFGQQAGQAFASFFADLVSGQEGAGKKLLAAFLGMMGQMLVHTGVMLIQAGIAEVVLAHTWVGKFMGASAAAGYKAIATGMVLAATGGIMQGAASSMAQTNEAGTGGSFQQDVPRPVQSNQVQVMQVGAPGGPQSMAEAQSRQPIELRLKVESNDSHIVRVVERNVGANGRLRTVIQANA